MPLNTKSMNGNEETVGGGWSIVATVVQKRKYHPPLQHSLSELNDSK